ncbi:MAG: hypothetical protein IPM66_19955 [Acidobacteriota bacterium]|nr:MAG: hypothetical protein IPM66_19955 [Acidobacteriota bacterium]
MLRHRAMGVFLPVMILATGWSANGQPAGKSLGDITQDYVSKGLAPIVANERDRHKWDEIEELVFMDDEDGQPIHPTLRWLWQWLDTSGHTVYVDIRHRRGAINIAGSFTFKKFDPSGERHIGVIRLNLSNIDQAHVEPSNRLKNGFIPFVGLGKTERYLEVLGHEMSHAVHILSNLELSNSVIEVIDRTNEVLLDKNRERTLHLITPEFRRQLKKRDELLNILETKAADMEKVVWREILDGMARRDKIVAGADR